MNQAHRLRWLVLAAALVAVTGCWRRPVTAPVEPEVAVSTPEPPGPAVPRAASAFAAQAPYQPVAVAPAVPDYTLKDDLSQVANRVDYPRLSAADRADLARQGFLAIPLPDAQMDSLYRDNLAENRPSFVTADAALYAFQRVCEDTRRRLEAESYPGLLIALTLTLLERTQAQYDQLAGAELRDAARANLAYLAVAASLLGLNTAIETNAARLARLETGRVTAHNEDTVGEVLPYRLDYRHLAPGREDGATEKLARYRRALAWLQHTPLPTRVTTESGAAEPHWRSVRQLALLCQALTEPPDAALRHWEALQDSQSFIAGAPTGVTLGQAVTAAQEAFGAQPALADLADFGKLRAFAQALEKRGEGTAVPAPREAGWPGPCRVYVLAPPRRTDDELLAGLANPTRRDAASGVELFAALGVPRAETLVNRFYRLPTGNTRYAETFAALRSRLDAVEPDVWRRDLIWGRWWACAPLNDPLGRGWLAFQRSSAWGDRGLMTTLATWAAERRRWPTEPPGPPDVRPAQRKVDKPPLVYVEPVPEVFSRLAWLSATLLGGLETHRLATEPIRDSHRTFQVLMSLLRQVAAKELANRSISELDRTRLAAFGHELHWLISGLDGALSAAQTNPPLVADLGPAGPGRRCYAGAGPVQQVLVVVPDSGGFYLARGALLSYLEAVLPEREPLTDARWRELLAGTSPPGTPEWTASFQRPNPEAPYLPAPTAGLPQ